MFRKRKQILRFHGKKQCDTCHGRVQNREQDRKHAATVREAAKLAWNKTHRLAELLIEEFVTTVKERAK